MSTGSTLEDPDRIEEFFEGKTVLITGATGFLGKVLTEKLLRACPKVKYVATLVRTKKSVTPEQRMQDILKGPLFDTIRRMYGPDHLKKVVTIAGNVSEKGLSLCPEDRSWLLEEVQVVFHCAATIRFDEPLRKAVLLNVRGTKEVLDLAKGMMNLQVFQYVSTAYCHMEEAVLHERAYDPPANPHHIIKICEWLRQQDVEMIAPRLLGKSPNTYAYTKALAEALVVEQMDNLPLQILRPSIVVPIWKEPIPGWTDNINGAAGLLIGAGKGVIRTMYIKGDAAADYISVDVVVNGLLVAAFLTSLNVEKRIYHITSNGEVRITHDELINGGRKIVQTKVPLPGMAWYPGGSTKTSRLYNNFCIFLYHWIPAVLVDSLLYILGYEPVLMRVQRRVAKGFEVMEYYANNQWTFNNKESLALRKLMNPTEQQKYKLDSEGFDFEEYLLNCVICVRRYILNEPDETIPASRRHMMIKIVETKIPLPGVAWYPGGSVKRSKIHNNISFFLYHWIPAIIADAILYLLGYDPVLMRVQRRVAKGCRIMEYYANHKWSFNNQETIDHRKHLNQTEIKKYKYDFEGADFEEYMTNCIISVRRFILNEPDETVPACKRHMTVMWILDRSLKALMVYLFFSLLYQHVLLRVM